MADESLQNLNNTQEGKTDESTSQEDVSPIEEAKKIQEENKKILEQLIAERKKMEKAAADMMIGGRSYAGQKTEKKEDTPKEYADKVMKGVIKAK